MAGSAQADKSSRFTAFFRRKKHAGPLDFPEQSLKAEASPARSAVSLNTEPSAIVQEKNSAPGAVATSATSVHDTGATLIDSQTDTFERSVEPDLWSRAYQKLDGKTKKWIENASQKESGEEKAQDLIEIVREREEVYKDATPKLKVGDREIVWRDYANKVVAWVTAIGDISINFAPAPSSVVWSAVKVLLKVRLHSYAQADGGEMRKPATIRITVLLSPLSLLPFLPLLLYESNS